MTRSILFFQNLKNYIDKPDVFIFSGLILLGRGLWLYLPWVSLTVCGALLILLGFLGALGVRK
jgi:hypothetical protein